MPNETQTAVNWALQQRYEVDHGILLPVSPDLPFTIVDKVREYFNINDIEYNTFSYNDLLPYLENVS